MRHGIYTPLDFSSVTLLANAGGVVVVVVPSVVEPVVPAGQ
ncbi:MAG: hypothetical protein WCY90_00025 [Bacilli bacterium]